MCGRLILIFSFFASTNLLRGLIPSKKRDDPKIVSKDPVDTQPREWFARAWVWLGQALSLYAARKYEHQGFAYRQYIQFPRPS